MSTRMFRFAFAIFAVGALSGYFVGQHHLANRAMAEDAPTAGSNDSDLATVLTVQHGDEFEVMWKPNVPVRFSVRLSDADTPYRNQKFGEQAAQALSDMVYGKKVKLEFTNPDKPNQDRSNRLLAFVKTPDGKFVNVEMISQGWANAMNHRNPYDEQFKAAEAQAKSEKRGRWSDAPAKDPAPAEGEPD